MTGNFVFALANALKIGFTFGLTLVAIAMGTAGAVETSMGPGAVDNVDSAGNVVGNGADGAGASGSTG